MRDLIRLEPLLLDTTNMNMIKFCKFLSDYMHSPEFIYDKIVPLALTEVRHIETELQLPRLDFPLELPPFVTTNRGTAPGRWSSDSGMEEGASDDPQHMFSERIIDFFLMHIRRIRPALNRRRAAGTLLFSVGISSVKLEEWGFEL